MRAPVCLPWLYIEAEACYSIPCLVSAAISLSEGTLPCGFCLCLRLLTILSLRLFECVTKRQLL